MMMRVGGGRTAPDVWRRLSLCLLAVALSAGMAACGGGSPAAQATVPDAAPPEITPVAPSGWTTYSNSAFKYSVEYPANWFLSEQSTTTDTLEIYNFDPLKIDNIADIPPPPFDKFGVDVYPNAEKLSLADFFDAFRSTDPEQPPTTSQTTKMVTLAGHAALLEVQQPVEWASGKIVYPSVTYFLPIGGNNMLILSELYSPGGAASAPFAHLTASVRFTA